MAGSAPLLSVVLVHYHDPAAVTTAIAALRRDAAPSGFEAELLVVDNGSSTEERGELARLGAAVIEGGGNHGFAAGVNRGVERAAGRFLLVLNPDVEVLPGCCAALVAELERGAAATAPRLYWDRERRYLLPPGEERTRSWELLALSARRRPASRRAARARARWRRDARRHWLVSGPLPSLRLSGAAIAFTREAWRRVGPFDEAYRLYFEETDWLLRLAAAGLEARQVAAAEAVHTFAHATRREPMAAAWFEASARRFRAAHYGRWFARLYERLAALASSAPVRAAVLPRWRPGSLTLEPPGLEAVSAPGRLWIELSPNREGFPAAATCVDAAELGSWAPPFALMEASGISAASLCVVGEDGRELDRRWLDTADRTGQE